MKATIGRPARARRLPALAAALFGALLLAQPASAEKVRIAVGGFACICYLPTLLTEQLGFYKEAGLEVELADFKGGSTALTAVMGGSADVVSGFYDHTVSLAAKGKQLQAFLVFDK